MTGIWRVRAAMPTLMGALAVHQARYRLTPRDHDHELAAVHAYLAWLMPVAAALVFVAVVELGARLSGRAAIGRPSCRGHERCGWARSGACWPPSPPRRRARAS